MEEDVNNQGNRVFAPPTETHLPIHKEARPIPSPHEKGGTIFVYTQKRVDSVNSQSALFFREKERQVSALFFLC